MGSGENCLGSREISETLKRESRIDWCNNLRCGIYNFKRMPGTQLPCGECTAWDHSVLEREDWFRVLENIRVDCGDGPASLGLFCKSIWRDYWTNSFFGGSAVLEHVQIERH